ncbi:MAG: HAMP domain-containing histidine kinase [Lachnospiraceae bacterium]|nr:HAMP domain-containing histidine kinase [Lachnospiraceae bacterium]
MKKRYYRTVFKRLTLSLLLSLVVMIVFMFFMEAIKGTVWEWFNKHISSNEETLIKTLVIIFFIISMTIFIASFMWLTFRRSSYIKKIVKAVEQISKGELSVRIPVNGDDELSYLSSSINNMVDELNTLIQRDKDQEKRRDEFITKVAHDLRTPMTSVMGYLKLIEKDVEMDPDLERKYLGTAVRKAEQMQGLIEDMFSYMKLASDDYPLNISKVWFIRLIEQVIDEMYPLFEKNGITCNLKTDIKSLPINADGALLARLFDNLLNNAVKYGKEGKVINISVKEKDDMIVTKVTNFGTVISAEEQGKVFEKFYRTDASRSSETGGTGLGLAIAANIVKLHGGRIDCRSDKENGTSFIVSLPASLKVT